MPEAKVGKYNFNDNKVTRRLKISDYILEIDGKDIVNVEVTYNISSRDVVYFKDGKKDRVEEVPELEIELYGTDNEGKEAWISFMIDTDVNYLNSLPNVPTDITNRLTEAENFIKRPNKDSSEFLDFNLPNNKEDDMYKQLTSLHALKLKDNEFILKFSVGYEVFTYFKLVIE